VLVVFVIVFVLFWAWMQGQYVVPILMYHSISAADSKSLFVLGRHRTAPLCLNNVSPASFEWQMRFLKDNGYQVITLDDYVEGNRQGKKFNHKTVVITFDDGYVDNYTNAFPVLKKYHFPATIFLISDFVSRNSNVLTWEEIKEMDHDGISFESHTRRHAYLPKQTPEQLKDEIITSKHDIEAHLGKPVYYMAYPCGGFNEKIKAVVALAGYKAALTTNRGTDRYDIDLYELSRIHINNWDNELTFMQKMSGFYNLFRKLKPAY